MTNAALVAWAAEPTSAGLLALLLARGRLRPRLFLDALAIGLTLGAAVAVALAPFDLRANPLHVSPLTLAFGFAGAPEEGIKLIGVAAFLNAHYLARNRRDVVLAAGALSLGFAALENIFYLANAGAGWATLALERALTATPFHVFTGLAGGFAIASLRPGVSGVALGLLAWLGLATIHGVYDFAVFAGAPGATPEALRRFAGAVDPVVVLRALLCAAEAAAAIVGGAAVVRALAAPREAALGRAARLLVSRSLGWLIGLSLAGGALIALAAGALIAAMLEATDLFLRVAVYAIMPLALGLAFVAAPASPAPLSPRARRAWAGAGALAALAVATAASAWGPMEWRELHALRFEARAARLSAHGDYARAIDAYSQALSAQPARIEALSQRAQAYAALKRFDAALADVDAALRAAPGIVALYIQRSDLDRRRNDPAAAAADLGGALRRRPGDPELLALRAEALLEAGDAQGARADLAEAGRAAPDNAVVRRVLATSAVDAGDFDGALRELNAALHANPSDPVATFQRGRIWLYKKEPGRARADFLRADPSSLYPALWGFLADGGDANPELQKRLVAAPGGWPAPVARMLLKEIGPDAARAAAGDDGERCEADFYFAMSRLSQDSSELSATRLGAAVKECPTGFIEHEGAKAELRGVAP